MRGPLAQGRQGTADEAGLPGDLYHRVPVVVAHLVVGALLTPVRRDQDRARRNLAAFAPGQAGHRMAAVDRLPGHLAAQPRRAAENEYIHDL